MGIGGFLADVGEKLPGVRKAYLDQQRANDDRERSQWEFDKSKQAYKAIQDRMGQGMKGMKAIYQGIIEDPKYSEYTGEIPSPDGYNPKTPDVYNDALFESIERIDKRLKGQTEAERKAKKAEALKTAELSGQKKLKGVEFKGQAPGAGLSVEEARATEPLTKLLGRKPRPSTRAPRRDKSKEINTGIKNSIEQYEKTAADKAEKSPSLSAESTAKANIYKKIQAMKNKPETMDAVHALAVELGKESKGELRKQAGATLIWDKIMKDSYEGETQEELEARLKKKIDEKKFGIESVEELYRLLKFERPVPPEPAEEEQSYWEKAKELGGRAVEKTQELLGVAGPAQAQAETVPTTPTPLAPISPPPKRRRFKITKIE